jgi:hypothetical protein
LGWACKTQREAYVEILDITVHWILLVLLFVTPWAVALFCLRIKKKVGFIYINLVAFPISFFLVLLIAYWPHFFADFRLVLMDFDFDGTTDDERTRHVDSSYKEEANRLYNSNMGIGWPLQAILVVVYYFPYFFSYPSVVFVVIKIAFEIRKLLSRKSRPT